MSARAPDLLEPRNRPEVEAAFEALPEEIVGEILDGDLFAQPRPARPHTRSSSRMGMKLGGAFDLGDNGPGGWVILDEPELHVGKRPGKLIPDLAGWSRARMPDALGDDAPAHDDPAPDWICEVISSGTERIDRGRKMRSYHREGVAHLWFLSPVGLEGGRWVMLEEYEDDAVVHAEPFDAVGLELGSIGAR